MHYTQKPFDFNDSPLCNYLWSCFGKCPQFFRFLIFQGLNFFLYIGNLLSHGFVRLIRTTDRSQLAILISALHACNSVQPSRCQPIPTHSIMLKKTNNTKKKRKECPRVRRGRRTPPVLPALDGQTFQSGWFTYDLRMHLGHTSATGPALTIIS